MKNNEEDAVTVKTLSAFLLIVYSLNTDTLFFKATIFRDQTCGSASIGNKRVPSLWPFFVFSASKGQPYCHLQSFARYKT